MILDDTIAAISTAAGNAARAIVRLSGPAAVALGQTVFAPASLADIGGFRSVDGRISLGRSGIQTPCVAYVFRAPRSYTRQDVVELHIPGGGVMAAELLRQLVEAGARRAEAGEFTARAFFAGRIDLSAAEAVADVINAADDAELRSAVAAMGGKVHRLCEAAASRLADTLAVVEASADLATENLELDDPVELSERLRRLARELAGVARRAGDTPETARRAHAVIAGRANVGKSSLLNAMTGTDRAIVSATAGTTRDVLTAAMTLPGGQSVTVCDAAGFVGAGLGLDAAADSAARSAVATADVIIFVVDACGDCFGADARLLAESTRANPRAPLIILANKIDVARGDALDRVSRALKPDGPLIATSCVFGAGLEAAAQALADKLDLSALRSGQAMGLHDRQKQCLLAAAGGARRAGDLLCAVEAVSDVAELAAFELRGALAQLGQISGQIVAEDILGRIFSRFCVGK